MINNPKTTVVEESKKHKKPIGRLKFAFLVVGLALLAGFGGSLVFWKLGFAGSMQRPNVATRDTIVMQEGEVTAEVAKKVGPSVVSIITESTSENRYGFLSRQQGAGTGIILSSDGYVVTNRHVVPQGTSSLELVLSDGTRYKNVDIVGSDNVNDVAFLKIRNVNNLQPAKLGDSSSMQVGQKVIAIGNALGEYQNTVTSGIISAFGRPVVASNEAGANAEQLQNLLQTDAAINPGNSGGPLVNLKGEVIGINTAVASNAEGIGFAIPINDIRGLTEQLLSQGRVVRPYMGVRYVSLTPEVVAELGLKVKEGAVIIASNGVAVESNSPAARAGLQELDVITAINNQPVDIRNQLSGVLSRFSPGEKVKLSIKRGDKDLKVDLTLGSFE